MKYLILCSFFPPDSAISAVRPYMFSKYLYKDGNEITVIRSGEFNNFPDDSLPELPSDISVISFLGNECDAEKYIRGEYKRKIELKNSTSAIPSKFGVFLRKLYHIIREPYDVCNRISTAKRFFHKQKQAIDSLEDKEFDIVFSTYSNLENVFGGEYASKKFNAKWIMDFRDPITEYGRKEGIIWNIIATHIEKKILKTADVCTVVSEGLKNDLMSIYKDANLYVLYNGYESENNTSSDQQNHLSDKLTFCYTGQFYGTRLEALDVLLLCLKEMIEKGDIASNKLRFIYAGPDSDVVKAHFNRFSLTRILEDHGYVTRNEALLLQEEADVFLVLSWNTAYSQGVLTGKFFEGIRCRKPILSIVMGNIPNSDLSILNSKYHYGFCYEEANKDVSEQKLVEFLYKCYSDIITSGKIKYNQSEELSSAFSYKNLTKDLERLSIEIEGD